jgi:CelD/BcsL family acetyltransferase involved in cellulose biosynthesis
MLTTEVLTGPHALQEIASAWERLWWSSHSHAVNDRPAMVALFQQCFAPEKVPCAVVVRSNERPVGLLPLLLSPRGAWLRRATSAGNEWAQCGRPLVMRDDGCAAAISTALLQGVAGLGTGAVWLEQMPLDDRVVKGLVAAARRLGWPVRSRPSYEVGLIRLPETVERFHASLSRNRRKKLRHDQRLAASQGELRLVAAHESPPEQLAAWLVELEAIEQASWKQSVGGTFAQHPAARGFLQQWAARLHADGQLRLYLLELGGECVAFDLGSLARGVYSSWKTGYRAACAGFAPGHQLNALICERLIESREAHCIDTIGPLDRQNNPWCNDAWRNGRVVIAPGSWLRNAPGRSVVSLLQAWDAWRPVSEPAGFSAS